MVKNNLFIILMLVASIFVSSCSSDVKSDRNYVVKDNKLVYNKTSALNYVRPVITLNADSRIITGDGSKLNPYIIN